MLLLLLVVGAHGLWPFSRARLAQLAERALGFDSSDTCGFTRADALECIARYIDVNHDREIERAEFEAAKARYLPPLAQKVRWIARAMGYDATYEMVLAGCDVAPRDGRLTLSDWEGGAAACLPGQRDLCMFSTVCRIAAEHKV
jgi:hypothetical protein